MRIPGWLQNTLRVTTEKYFSETCDIDVEITSVGQFGTSAKPAWTRVQSGVRCQRITVGKVGSSTRAETVGDQESIEDLLRVVLPAGTPISNSNYRLTIGGRYYYVVRIVDDRANETDVQVIVSRNR